MSIQSKTILAEKLTALRERRGLSQEDVAQAIHVSRQAISKWEGGKAVPSTDNLKLLSRLYAVTVDELLDDEIPCKSQCSAAKELQSDPLNTQLSKRKIERHSMLLGFCVGILVTAIVAGGLMLVMTNREEVIPLEDVPVDTAEKVYSTISFSIG